MRRLHYGCVVTNIRRCQTGHPEVRYTVSVYTKNFVEEKFMKGLYRMLHHAFISTPFTGGEGLPSMQRLFT